MRDYIYTVTAITKDGNDGRCFGFFFNETDARIAAYGDYGGLQESLYRYLVVEKQSNGIHALSEVIQWYEWGDSTEHWEKCEQPEFEGFRGITNWNGIG